MLKKHDNEGWIVKQEEAREDQEQDPTRRDKALEQDPTSRIGR